jgi:hypothetical protein
VRAGDQDMAWVVVFVRCFGAEGGEELGDGRSCVGGGSGSKLGISRMILIRYEELKRVASLER